jgi:hypothetical protein
MFNDDKHIEKSERRRDRHEEVAGHDRLRVVAKKGRPALIAARAARRPLGMYFLTVRGETCNPNLSINSLAIRSSPHRGFSLAILRINARSSAGIGGRPDCDL